MELKDVIKRIKKFRDYYGFDIVISSPLETEDDCVRVLESHKKWLEDALTDALTGIDTFKAELGLE